MSNGRRPLFRLKFRTKDGQKYDIGTVWPGRFPDSHDVKFETQTTQGQYPKLNAEEALRRAANRDGFISLVDASPRQNGNGPRRNGNPNPGGGNSGGFGGGDDFGGGGGGDFGDDDIPFRQFDERRA